LKGIDWGKVESASGESVRQIVTVKVGINSDKAREINKLIKEKGPKGVSSQTQGEQIRVTGKKRDDLQETMALLKRSDLEVPLQFEKFSRLRIHFRMKTTNQVKTCRSESPIQLKESSTCLSTFFRNLLQT